MRSPLLHENLFKQLNPGTGGGQAAGRESSQSVITRGEFKVTLLLTKGDPNNSNQPSPFNLTLHPHFQ